jgi:FkbM family methyltransferase
MFYRTKTYIRRLKSANKLGIKWTRAASFNLPEKIIIDGVYKSISLPQERGVKVDFVQLLLDDCYQIERIKHSVSTILDVGSNVGLFSLAARLRFPNAKIHAYEPNKSLEPFLQVQSRIADFVYFFEAIGEKCTCVSLELNDESNQVKVSEKQNGPIPQIDLKEAVQRIGGYVDVLKIDCEGCEWSLFDDMAIWQSIKTVTMEYHLDNGHTVNEIKQSLKKLGFKILSIHHVTNYGLLFATMR